MYVNFVLKLGRLVQLHSCLYGSCLTFLTTHTLSLFNFSSLSLLSPLWLEQGAGADVDTVRGIAAELYIKRVRIDPAARVYNNSQPVLFVYYFSFVST